MTMVVENCSKCGIRYHVPEDYDIGRRNDHATFYCPNGHGQYFPQVTTTDTLRRQLSSSEAQRVALSDQLGAAKRALEAAGLWAIEETEVGEDAEHDV